MWDKLKEILNVGGGKAVLVEDGEPRYVVLTVDEYLKLANNKGQAEAPASPASPTPDESSPFRQPSGEPADEEGSIFRGAIDPSSNEAPVDLSDIDTAGGVPELADYSNAQSPNLDDLPL